MFGRTGAALADDTAINNTKLNHVRILFSTPLNRAQRRSAGDAVARESAAGG
jgi:hypothetical protein